MAARKRWTEGYHRERKRSDREIGCVIYSLGYLEEHGFVSRKKARQFREMTGLADFSWEATWAARDQRKPGDALASARGCVILIHGWDGSHAIWEDLAACICQQNPRLFVLAPDISGFGGSPFALDLPPLTACDPAAAMRSIEAWVEILGLRSSKRAQHRYRVLTFVGHSMGGAAVFYLDESRWRPHEAGRLALAPALLFNDLARKELYKTLGFGIWAGSPTQSLNWVKKRIAPHLIQALIGDASQVVKDEHLRIFNNTPKGVLAQTFYAMGAAVSPDRRRWQNFRILLAHRDRLVGLESILLLLEELGFTSEDIRVVLGDHYFFSISQQSRRLHAPNRELLIEQVLALHQSCYRAQRSPEQ